MTTNLPQVEQVLPRTSPAESTIPSESKLKMRQVSKQRNTRETKIQLTINLDGSGKVAVRSGISYLDHMLEQLAFHGLFDLELQCEGDLEVDCHHTVEDIGITLGQAFAQAVGDKRGVRRYGHAYVPLDEALVLLVQCGVLLRGQLSGEKTILGDSI